MDEWDEEVEKETVFFFGEEVETPTGERGIVTEIDSESNYRYRVDAIGHIGWFTPTELKKTS